jgi:hypothetical protein
MVLKEDRQLETSVRQAFICSYLGEFILGIWTLETYWQMPSPPCNISKTLKNQCSQWQGSSIVTISIQILLDRLFKEQYLASRDFKIHIRNHRNQNTRELLTQPKCPKCWNLPLYVWFGCILSPLPTLDLGGSVTLSFMRFT